VGRRPTRRLALIAALACTAGCAHRMGEQASSGALRGLKQASAGIAEEAAQTPPEQQLSRLLAQRAVEGAVDALDTPEQRAQIERIVAGAVATATRAAVDSATSQLIGQLGAQGEGPLGRSLASTGAQVSTAISTALVQSVVGGVGAELSALTPDCGGADRLTCIQGRLNAMARSTAAGFTSGVKESIGWQLLFLAFAGGTVAGALGSWLWSRGHSRSRRRFQPA
jgi:hypothetical protein